MKEYKTFNQQLTILRNRGMIVPTNGSPKRFLEQENYYNVINNISFCQKHTTYTPNVASQKIIEDLHYLRLFIHIYFVE